MRRARATRKGIPYGLFAVLLVLDVAVLVIEKTAALHAMSHDTAFYVRLITQPWMWMGLALGPVQLWVWTKILSCTKLSLAYPLSSLSYPLAMFAAQIVFRERLSAHVWFGAMLITIGVAVVSSTASDRKAIQPPVSF